MKTFKFYDFSYDDWFEFLWVYDQKQPLELFYEKSILRNFAKFSRKHLCHSLFFNKTLLKKRLWHRCFPVNFAKFLRTSLGDCFCMTIGFSVASDFDPDYFIKFLKIKFVRVLAVPSITKLYHVQRYVIFHVLLRKCNHLDLKWFD